MLKCDEEIDDTFNGYQRDEYEIRMTELEDKLKQMVEQDRQLIFNSRGRIVRYCSVCLIPDYDKVVLEIHNVCHKESGLSYPTGDPYRCKDHVNYVPCAYCGVLTDINTSTISHYETKNKQIRREVLCIYHFNRKKCEDCDKWVPISHYDKCVTQPLCDCPEKPLDNYRPYVHRRETEDDKLWREKFVCLKGILKPRAPRKASKPSLSLLKVILINNAYGYNICPLED